MSGKSFAPGQLVSAIRAGRLDAVIAAIDDGGDIEEADIHGCPGLPLRTACFAGDMAIVHELLRRGANVNAMAADGPGAPLRLAVRGGHPDIAALLVQFGAAIPAGLDLDASIRERLGSPPGVAGEVDIPLLPDAPGTAEAPPALDFTTTDPYPGHPVEEVDINACYGTDTNLLTLDILRLEDSGGTPPAPAAKPGFWKTSRRKT